MTKLSFGAHPYLLGFDQLERLVERTAKSGSDAYPPYNIEQSGPDGKRAGPQAMMSGVSRSSIREIWSFSTSFCFFSRTMRS